jgi:predicted nucleic acid-binding protein
MIVVDASVIAAFWIKSPQTDAAIRVRSRDADWIVPLLWRSEFRSILRQYLVRGSLGFADVVWIANKAEAMFRGREYSVDSRDVLKLVERTGHSSYDCEYVALAESEGLELISRDRNLTRVFPSVAVNLEDFARL